MKKGQSYITISDSDKPNHPIVKALREKGYSDFFLIYASHWATDSGWTLEGKNLPNWLGYTITESLKIIKMLPNNG